MTRTALALAALAAAGAVALAARTAPAPAQPEADPAAMQAAMDTYLKSIQPGEKHKWLEQFVGEWNTTMRMFWGPGAPPVETSGTAVYSMIHGGRFLRQETTGAVKFPGPDGAMKEYATTGLGLTGYDNNRRLYVINWTDSMGTAMYIGSGSLSPDGRILTMFGAMDEPMTGEIGKTVKYITRVESPDRHVFEIHEVLYGDPFKVVEIEYTRRP